MSSGELEKNREIVFHPLPPGQLKRALTLLQGLDGLVVEAGPGANRLLVRYRVCEYTLEGIESALMIDGFHLDNSLLSKLKRSLAYFSESVQRRNILANVPDINSQKAFIAAYDRRLHGDSDDTPEEWRRYK
ncbi:MAG TPA: hypothetical protein PKC12_03445 [Thiobacillaceae bacterium]|nr:hypothetical protein [Thiobacillaceae bacterium]